MPKLAFLRRYLAVLDRSARGEEIRQAERRGGLPRSKPQLAKPEVGCSIEPSHYGVALSEHRSSGAAPLRCPKPIYDLAAEVINEATESFRFAKEVWDDLERKSDAGQVPAWICKNGLLNGPHGLWESFSSISSGTPLRPRLVPKSGLFPLCAEVFTHDGPFTDKIFAHATASLRHPAHRDHRIASDCRRCWWHGGSVPRRGASARPRGVGPL